MKDIEILKIIAEWAEEYGVALDGDSLDRIQRRVKILNRHIVTVMPDEYFSYRAFVSIFIRDEVRDLYDIEKIANRLQELRDKI